MPLGAPRAPLIVGALMLGFVAPMRPTAAECGFCEIAAMQDASFAIGHRFLTLMPRQSEIARRGGGGDGFAPPPRKPEDRDIGWNAWGVREPGPHGWALWLAGFRGVGWRGDSAVVGSVQYRLDAAGVAGGVDYRLSRTMLVGVSMAFGTGCHAVGARESTGNAQTALLGLYGAWSEGAFHADLAIFYGYSDHVTARRIRTEEIDERASGWFSGHQLGGRLEAGWRMSAIPIELTPFVALAVQRLHQRGYVEDARAVSDGSIGNAGLTVAARSAWSVRSEIGIQLVPPTFVDSFLLISPRVRVAWAHEFATTRGGAARLSMSPADPFVAQGVGAARNAILLSAGMNILPFRQITGYAQFDAEWSSSGHVYAGSGGVRISW